MRLFPLMLLVCLTGCALGTAAINKQHLTPCQLAQAAYSDAQDGAALAHIVHKGESAADAAIAIADLAVRRECGAPVDARPAAPVT